MERKESRKITLNAPAMTSSSFEIEKNWDFYFYKRPEPPFGSRRRLDHKTARSQVLSLKVNYTVNCAVNCCNRVLQFLRIRNTCGFVFAWKTPKFQYILSLIVWKFGKRAEFRLDEVKLSFPHQNRKKIAKMCFLRQSRTEYLGKTPILASFQKRTSCIKSS